MEAKNIVKLLGILVISTMVLLPTVSAVTADANVDVSIKGGFKGIKFTVTNDNEWSVEASYRIVGKTLLNTSNSYDITNTTEIDAESTETFSGVIPNDLAILYVEITCEGHKDYKYGIAFNGIVFLPWSDN